MAAATVIAGNKSGTSASISAPAPGGNNVVVDGQAQNVTGPVSCTQVNGNLSIGIGDPSTGVGAVLSNTDPPVVQAVGLAI